MSTLIVTRAQTQALQTDQHDQLTTLLNYMFNIWIGLAHNTKQNLL